MFSKNCWAGCSKGHSSSFQHKMLISRLNFYETIHSDCEKILNSKDPQPPFASITTGSECGHKSVYAKETLGRHNHQLAFRYTGDGWKGSLYLGVWGNCSLLNQRKNLQFLAGCWSGQKVPQYWQNFPPWQEYLNVSLMRNRTQLSMNGLKTVWNHLTSVSLITSHGTSLSGSLPRTWKGERRDDAVSSEHIPWSEGTNTETWYSQRSFWCHVAPQTSTQGSTNTTPWPLPGAGRQIRGLTT